MNDPRTEPSKKTTEATRRQSGAQPAGGDAFVCRRCGQAGPRLPERPFKGALGEQILASVCQPCWTEWIHTGTKVINELRLVLADPRDAETYDRHMKEFLNIE